MCIFLSISMLFCTFRILIHRILGLGFTMDTSAFLRYVVSVWCMCEFCFEIGYFCLFNFFLYRI